MSNNTKVKQSKSKKRHFPTTFLDCRSLVQVPAFPLIDGGGGGSTKNNGSSIENIISSEVTTDVGKQIFLERLVKEIVKPFRPNRGGGRGQTFVMNAADGKLQRKTKTKPSRKGATSGKEGPWRLRLKVGTNQCLRVLESENKNVETGSKANHPALIVLAKDVYPPTMLAHVPVIAREKSIPLLILPGKASSELGKSLGIRKTSLLLFMESDDDKSTENKAINSFIEFVISQIPKMNNNKINKPAS